MAARAVALVGHPRRRLRQSAAWSTATKFCDAFLAELLPESFADLTIPLTVRRHRSARGAKPCCSRKARCSPRSPPRWRCPGWCGRSRCDGRVLVDGGVDRSAAVRRCCAARPTSSSRSMSRAAAASAQGVPDPWESLFAAITVMGHTIVGAEAQGRRARPRAAAEHRHLPHARFLPGERDPARRRADQGGGEGEARRAARPNAAP